MSQENDRQERREQQRQIDTRALEVAVEALTKVDSHEVVCGVRYQELTRSINKVFDRIWYAALGMIIALMSIAGVLLSWILHP